MSSHDMPDNATQNIALPETEKSLNGITLEAILVDLVARYGWDEMGKCIDIRCFTSTPSVKSSLKFLRKTPWARKKVEELYLGRRL
jgi:uncharacterized protein (DUF2132 family)